MNKQQKNYIKAVVGFVLAAIILCAGIMTALYLMREEKGMENLMAPVLKRLIAGILLFGLTVCWGHFLKKSVSKVAGIIVIVLLSLFFCMAYFWNSAGKSIKTAECESGKSRISWV
jgi:drug/metabolite transporter (DMT)-like permease